MSQLVQRALIFTSVLEERCLGEWSRGLLSFMSRPLQIF